MTSTRKPSLAGKALGGGCLVLFALPFLCVPVVMLTLIGRTLIGHREVQDWVRRPAVVLEASVKQGDGTIEATARYRYEWEGVEYEGTRVLRHGGGTDNIGSFQKRWARKLRQAEKSGEPIPCWVDPDNPRMAVLSRELRTEIVLFHAGFALAFGLGGSMPLVFGLVQLRRRRREREAPEDQPWRALMDEDDVLRPTEGSAAWYIVAAAAFWNVISFPAAFLGLSQPDFRSSWPIVVLMLFPLIGVGLAAAAVHAVWRWHRFRTARLRLLTTPVFVGRELRAVLRINQSLPPATDVTARLEQCQLVRDSRGYSQVQVQWASERRLPHDLLIPGRLGDELTVGFAIPADAREGVSEDDGVWWRLVFTADLPGPDMRLTFPIPVVRDESMSPVPVATEDLPGVEIATTGEAVTDVAGLFARQGGRWQELPGGRLHAQTPPFQALGMHVVGFAFAGLLLGGGGFLIHGDKWYGHIPFGLGLLLIWTTLRSFLRRSSLEVGPAGVRVEERGLLAARARHLAWSDIERVTAKNTGSAGNTQYFDVVALQRGKPRRVKLMRWVVGQDLADECAERIDGLRGR